MRRTRLKRKRSRYPSPAQLQERREWAYQFSRCWLCNCGDGHSWHYGAAILDVHEIASRGQAKDWANVKNYARVCRTCHDDVLSWLCEAAQCALKSIHDPDNYDRSWINEARGEADTAISAGEVAAWVKFFNAVRR